MHDRAPRPRSKGNATERDHDCYDDDDDDDDDDDNYNDDDDYNDDGDEEEEEDALNGELFRAPSYRTCRHVLDSDISHELHIRILVSRISRTATKNGSRRVRGERKHADVSQRGISSVVLRKKKFNFYVSFELSLFHFLPLSFSFRMASD